MIESNYLKDDVKNIDQLLRIPAFQNWTMQELGMLLRITKIRRYNEGECIIREGDHDPWLYFLLSGRIRVVKEGMTLGSIETMGAMFGEMRVIDRLSRSASVFAREKTICLAVDTAARDRFVTDREADSILDRLWKLVSEHLTMRLRRANNELVRVKKEYIRLKRATG